VQENEADCPTSKAFDPAIADAVRGSNGSTWNRSFGEVGEVPTAFVTVTSRSLPAPQLGKTAVIEVSETIPSVASAPQKPTDVVPLKDVPVIVTDEPDGPWTGEIDET